MNNTFTCLIVLGMMLIADAICIGQTIELRDLMANSSIATLVTLEGLFAGVVIASAVSLIRKRLARRKKPVTRRPVPEAVQV